MSSLLPPNATTQEVAVAKTMARISDVPVPFASALDPMRSAEEMLPWLAWGFSVDTWGADWPVYVRRNTVQRSLGIHRRKGTVGALMDALAAVGVPVEIEEWHQRAPQGEPYTFRVLINSIATTVTREDIERILTTIESTKNLRSHLEALVPGLTSYGSSVATAVATGGTDVEVRSLHSDISILLAAIEEGEHEVESAVDALHQHLTVTMPLRAKDYL
ncbi:phage tail protein I [Stenotrophomonas sp. SAU14A_NAIMI4_5]|uniref:phage tail protein I n=1 Tax=Stenotrophomonas sp. SAU14A_NAIMI4_5 TaxID=2072413 RepID=UPI000D53DB26|nr:phage tail protein I [Stenotrophomonas sp. SAU14A_NAIMI4_5]AWH47945.1 phage tail protein I [Stenotrophomonas sp. SAU14A_NAIMI4_5]